MNAPTLGSDVPNILVVDDTPANLTLLARLLTQAGYRTRPVPNGTLALQAAAASPPDLILLDINMPDMNGYQVAQHLKQNVRLRDVPIIFLSALGDTADKVRAFEAGGVDYMTKPFEFEELRSRVSTHLQLHALKDVVEQENRGLQALVQAQVKEIAESQMAAIFQLASLAEYRDHDTGGHLKRVQEYCSLLSVNVDPDSADGCMIDRAFVRDIYQASALHDIGKVGIPDNVLLKPGRLTVDEFEIMKTHTTIGAQALEEVSRAYPNNAFINVGVAIARYHHEKWDGTGYPEGLAGADIPLAARIMAVVDVYDALRSKRPYKCALSHDDSSEIVVGGRGTHFDPEAVDAFVRVQNEFERISNT